MDFHSNNKIRRIARDIEIGQNDMLEFFSGIGFYGRSVTMHYREMVWKEIEEGKERSMEERGAVSSGKLTHVNLSSYNPYDWIKIVYEDGWEFHYPLNGEEMLVEKLTDLKDNLIWKNPVHGYNPEGGRPSGINGSFCDKMFFNPFLVNDLEEKYKDKGLKY